LLGAFFLRFLLQLLSHARGSVVAVSERRAIIDFWLHRRFWRLLCRTAGHLREGREGESKKQKHAGEKSGAHGNLPRVNDSPSVRSTPRRNPNRPALGSHPGICPLSEHLLDDRQAREVVSGPHSASRLGNSAWGRSERDGRPFRPYADLASPGTALLAKPRAVFLSVEFYPLQRAHIRQEFAIRLGFAQLVDEQFHGFDRRERVEHFA
jgi:hypothetical protein